MWKWWLLREFGGVQALSVLALLLAAGCGDGPAAPEQDPIAPLVGDWEATRMKVTNVANPTVSPDLIELGARFTINIQPSGQYTAILIFLGQSTTEIGKITVEGSTLTFHRSFPSPDTATASIGIAGDTVTLEGPTEFDFNLDGTPEPADATIVLVRK